MLIILSPSHDHHLISLWSSFPSHFFHFSYLKHYYCKKVWVLEPPHSAPLLCGACHAIRKKIPKLAENKFLENWISTHKVLPDITGRTALAVRADVVNAKYHVITNATYSCHNRNPVSAKFKHVTNIEICTLLCCDHSTLWKALHANMVEISARCSDKNVKILRRYEWISW